MKIDATSRFRQFLDEEIYRTVVRWNQEHQKHPYHFDFHGLTRKSAEWYIANPIKRASTQNSGEVEGQSSGDNATSGTLHDVAQARKDYLESKATGVELPTEESAKLDPKFAFGESTLIIHMCTKCRTASRILDCIDMGNGDNGLVINLCTICRALFNTQRRIKFFQHELACIKRRQIQ
ncbi:hypothetical protein CRE_16122 [Caenorhabditis remanei]|uniref:Uncharacterized protein n=1 Tax=Caenorhabditis remanei TaxID=31234 RepID=E3MBY0_CAERE|nr:hypothetical protein CRE_16122 [Caenorhabditis remanei]